MACYDTSPYLCTFDSGGGKDYSSVDTWEVDSDNDLSGYSGPVILDCYDSQIHSAQIQAISGATNATESIYRSIRPSPNCIVPFAGKVGTGAEFVVDGNASSVFTLTDPYFRLSSVCIQFIPTANASYTAVTVSKVGSKVLNCVIHDGYNSAYPAQAVHGVEIKYSQSPNGGDALAYNNIIYANTGSGIMSDQLFGNEYFIFACNTVVDNGLYGVYADGTRTFAWSNYAADNPSGDYREGSSYFNTSSGWNASKDNTSDLLSRVTDYKNSLDLTTSILDADYLPLSDDSSLSGSAGSGENWGRNPYDDFTAVYDFNDFFKNDTGGDPLSKVDARGTTRPDADIADSAWAVGATEYLGTPPIPVSPSSGSMTITGGIPNTGISSTTKSLSITGGTPIANTVIPVAPATGALNFTTIAPPVVVVASAVAPSTGQLRFSGQLPEMLGPLTLSVIFPALVGTFYAEGNSGSLLIMLPDIVFAGTTSVPAWLDTELTSLVAGFSAGSYLDVDLPAPEVSMTGLTGSRGSLNADLPDLIFSASAGAKLASIVPIPEILFSGTVGTAGSLVVRLPPFAALFSGDVQTLGQLVVNLPSIQTLFSGNQGVLGNLITEFPALSVLFSGYPGSVATLAVDIPALEALLTAYEAVSGDMVIVLPALKAFLEGGIDDRFDSETIAQLDGMILKWRRPQ